jgi:hypothetical protein
MDKHITQSRICLEHLLPQQEQQLNNIITRSNSYAHFAKLKTGLLSNNFWPNKSIIKISFISDSPTFRQIEWTPLQILKNRKNSKGQPIPLDPIEEHIRKLSPIEAIKKIIRERFQPIVGLKFVFVPKGGCIRIGFRIYEGANSFVGLDSLKIPQNVITMNFGWLDAGIIMHEFGHALGLLHEHEPIHGEPIQWNDSHLFKWAKITYNYSPQRTYNNLIDRYNAPQTNSSTYDPDSIMLYFYPADFTNNKKGVNPNMRLSLQDMTLLSNIYPGGQIQPQNFYNKIYPQNKNDEEHNNEKWWIIGGIIGSIVTIIIIFSIIIFFKHRKNKNIKTNSNTPQNFEEWKKINIQPI